eukprot:6486901-Amphidinium_carterae.1
MVWWELDALEVRPDDVLVLGLRRGPPGFADGGLAAGHEGLNGALSNEAALCKDLAMQDTSWAIYVLNPLQQVEELRCFQ